MGAETCTVDRMVRVSLRDDIKLQSNAGDGGGGSQPYETGILEDMPVFISEEGP